MLITNRLKKYFDIVPQIILLILIDQSIKIYINTYLYHKQFYFINNVLGFKPYLNTKYSWINNMADLGINKIIHIACVSTLLLVSLAVYDFIRYQYHIGKLEKAIFIFLFSGAFCSLIDKIFWGGSLDYILLEHFFIFDLKDVYITVFEVLIIGCAVFNYKGFRKLKGSDLIHDYKSYLHSRFSK